MVAASVSCATCSPDVRDRDLSTIDLADAVAVATIGRQLDSRDRTAFITYALVHWPGSKSYCGRAVAHKSRPAQTVGDAVATTLAFESQLAITPQAAARRLKIPDQIEENRLLIDRYEALLLQKQMLGNHPTGPDRKAKLARIASEMERVRLQRQRLIPRLESH